MNRSLDALDPELRGFVESVCGDAAALAGARVPDWPERRRIAESVRARWRAGGPAMASIEDHIVPCAQGDVCVRLFRPHTAAAPAPVCVYLHGGGWCMFSLDTHDRLMREYADGAGVVVAGVDYALAPEHPYPIALEQVLAAVAWLRASGSAHGLDANRIAFGGDSAGANLALAAALRLRERDALAGVRALVLNYGAWDPRIPEPIARELGGADAMLGTAEMDEFWRMYLQDDPARSRDPFAVPARANLRGLPPSLLSWGDRDVLGAQNADMAQRLRDAGVVVDAKEFRGAPHSFIEAMSVSAQAREAIERGCAWLRAYLSDAGAAERRA